MGGNIDFSLRQPRKKRAPDDENLTDRLLTPRPLWSHVVVPADQPHTIGRKRARMEVERSTRLVGEQKRVGKMPSANSKSKFGLINKKTRRVHRALTEKGPKSLRIHKEATQRAAAEEAVASKLDFERIKRLQKLLTRHEAAGKMDLASEVREQIAQLQAQQQ